VFDWYFDFDDDFYRTNWLLFESDSLFADIYCSYRTDFSDYLSNSIVSIHGNVSTPVPAAGMFNVDFVLLWGRPHTSATPFQPKRSRSMSSSVIALLLILSGSVHLNPGPGARFATLNVRSAHNKAAVLHDLIADHDLDIIALCETWIRNDDPPAIADDIAPPGFSVVHVLRPRTTTVGRNVGGGLAVIARDGLGLQQRRIPTTSASRTIHSRHKSLNWRSAGSRWRLWISTDHHSRRPARFTPSWRTCCLLSSPTLIV